MQFEIQIYRYTIANREKIAYCLTHKNQSMLRRYLIHHAIENTNLAELTQETTFRLCVEGLNVWFARVWDSALTVTRIRGARGPDPDSFSTHSRARTVSFLFSNFICPEDLSALPHLSLFSLFWVLKMRLALIWVRELSLKSPKDFLVIFPIKAALQSSVARYLIWPL